MHEQKCPNCGSNNIVFSHDHYKCSYCNSIFTDKTANKSAFKYSARLSQAAEHLEMRNYNRAYEIAKELCDIHPTDPRPYNIILLSLTLRLTNYHLTEIKQIEAANVWKKLQQLNALTEPMKKYAEKIHLQKLNKLSGMLFCDIICIFLGIIFFIVLSCESPEWIKVFFGLDIICTCYYCYMSNFFNTIASYNTEKDFNINAYNPFITSL